MPNLQTDLIRVLGAKVTMREGDKTRRVTKQLALLESLVAKGFKGDIRAVVNTFNLIVRVLGVDQVDSEDRPTDKADLDRLLLARARWLEAGTVYASASFATVTVERPGGGGGA